MPQILIFGTFDLLHPGHKFVIKEALKRACPNGEAGRGELHIVVARDKNVEMIKHQKPHQSEEERVDVLKKEFPDANIILGDSDNFLKPVREINPDLILLGYDQKLPPGISESDLGCKIERLPAFEPEKWKSSLQRG